MARARRPSHRRQPDRRRLRAAWRALLQATGARGDLSGTAKRAADLWVDHLLAGEQLDPAILLANALPCRTPTPVSLLDVDVHLVCPHHLTIAFGTAHLAYLPTDRFAPLGSLADLVTAYTARLVLQEEATAGITDALTEHLGAAAAVAMIEATHPCHNVTRPRAHRSRVITWASAGPRGRVRELRALLKEALG